MEFEVEQALALFEDLRRIVEDPDARAELPALFQRLGLWVGLTFRKATKGRTRKVRVPTSGLLTLGRYKPPVPLYGTKNRHGASQEAIAQEKSQELPAQELLLSCPNRHEEGASDRKASRGDMI